MTDTLQADWRGGGQGRATDGHAAFPASVWMEGCADWWVDLLEGMELVNGLF